MATTTVGSEFSVVNIVCSVTVSAVITGCAHRSQRTAMTVVAGDFHVRTLEGESRLHVVVEQPQVPCNRVVARLALIFESALV